jgi:general secretion pathway protein C
MDWSRFSHLSPADFQGLLSRRTVILAAMAIILYQGVGIFYKTLTLQLIRMRPAPAAEGVRPAAVAAREPAEAYRAIPERNLFGTTNKPIGGGKQAAAIQQQDIALQIDLRGTVAGAALYGFAVVEEKATRKQRLIKVGDVVAGAKVVRIRRNALDLLVDGQERVLKMVETKEAPILPPAQGGVASMASPPPPGAISVNRSEIQEALEDMGSLLRQAQIRPYFNAGVPDGFLINMIRRGSLYQKMGLANGDIIQEVNNRKIQTADDMTGLLNIIRSGAGLSLTIKRRGKQETLNYQFQ